MTDAELALLPRVELVLSGGGEGGAGGGGEEVVLSLEPQDYLHDEVSGCLPLYAYICMCVHV